MISTFIPQFLAAGILGYLFSDFFSGRREGERVDNTFRFTVGRYRLHIHNWIWSGLLIILCLILNINDPISLGILSGAMVQGLTYRDRFVIFYKAENFEKIYSRLYPQ